MFGNLLLFVVSDIITQFCHTGLLIFVVILKESSYCKKKIAAFNFCQLLTKVKKYPTFVLL